MKPELIKITPFYRGITVEKGAIMEASKGGLVIARRKLTNLKKAPKSWNITQWKTYMDKQEYLEYLLALNKTDPIPTPPPIVDKPAPVKPEPVKPAPVVTPVPDVNVPDVPAKPPVFTPLPTTPGTPQVNPPKVQPPVVEPQKPAPEPIVPPVVPGKPPVTNKRVTGDIMKFCRFAANNVSDQDFSWLTDGDINKNGYHTSYGRKPFGPVDEWYIIIPEYINATVKSIKLADGPGSSGSAFKFNGLIKEDSKFREVNDIIPAFFGKGYGVWLDHKIAPANSRLFAIKNIVPIQESNRAVLAAIPTEMQIIAEYDEVEKPKAKPRKRYKYQQLLGVNGHHYQICEASGRGVNRPDKLNILKDCLAGGSFRMYLGIEECLYNGKFTFQKMIRGSYHLDDVLAYNTSLGITTQICIRNNERDPIFKKFAYNITARYGPNKNIDPATLDVYTGDDKNMPKNEVRIGLNYLFEIQNWNESDGGWKERKIYFTPFEMAAGQKELYDIEKSVSPDVYVVSNGHALTRPGYLDGIGLWCAMHNNGKAPFDMISYHPYFRVDRSGQRVGSSNAAPPEHAGMREDIEALFECINYWWPDQDIALSIGETGASISDTNPDQAVKAIPGMDKFEVQAMISHRILLEALVAGLRRVQWYSYCDTSEYRNSDKRYPTPWDTSMGVANIDAKDVYTRRATLDYSCQMLKYLKDYEAVKESDRNREVFKHRFEKPGEPPILTLHLTSYEGKKGEETLTKEDFEGYKSVTIITPATGADNAKEETISVENVFSLRVPVFEYIVYVRLNR